MVYNRFFVFRIPILTYHYRINVCHKYVHAIHVNYYMRPTRFAASLYRPDSCECNMCWHVWKLQCHVDRFTYLSTSNSCKRLTMPWCHWCVDHARIVRTAVAGDDENAEPERYFGRHGAYRQVAGRHTRPCCCVRASQNIVLTNRGALIVDGIVVTITPPSLNGSYVLLTCIHSCDVSVSDAVGRMLSECRLQSCRITSSGFVLYLMCMGSRVISCK